MNIDENIMKILKSDNNLDSGEHRSTVEKSISLLSVAVKSYLKHGTTAEEVKMLSRYQGAIQEEIVEILGKSIRNNIEKDHNSNYQDKQKISIHRKYTYYQNQEDPKKFLPKEIKVIARVPESKKTAFFVSDKKLSNIDNEIKTQIVKASYLSKMEMLLQIYDMEKESRDKEYEFEHTIKGTKFLAEIIQLISENKKLYINEIRDKVNIDRTSLESLLTLYSVLFNIRESNGKTVISLTSEGKSLDKYISTRGTQERATSEAMIYNVVNQLLDNILTTLTTKRKIEFLPLEFLGLSEDKKRTLQRKYMQAMYEINKNREDFMTPRSVCTGNSMEEENDSHDNWQYYQINNNYILPIRKGRFDENN